MNDPFSSPSHAPPLPVRPRSGWSPITLMVVGAALLLLVVPQLVWQVQYASTRARLQAEIDISKEHLSTATESPRNFRWIVQNVSPSVVHIRTLSSHIEGETPQIEIGEPLDESFNGEGSGVIVDPSGYILTNHHVALSGEERWIKLIDGRVIQATLVGSDPLTDLALLKIEAPDLHAAVWGDSDQVAVGDWVLALGSPFGLEQTVTVGIVSAKSRQNLVEGEPYQDFLQTDAALNPGNSGGPLVNLRGEIIGVNTMILGQRFQGVSFAIPSAIARDICERLKRDKRVYRAWLGVQLKDLSTEDRKKLKVPTGQGVQITMLVRDTPADEAGLEAFDVVMSWNGEAVHSATELRLKIARTPIQSEAKVIVLRHGEPKEIAVIVTERPVSPQ